MDTGETGLPLLTVLIPVAEEHNTVCEVVIAYTWPSVVPGVLEMTLKFNHATLILVQVRRFL